MEIIKGLKIIGMLPVYNDEDVIEEVIEHLISEGIELVVLDNGSTDNSYKLCEKFLGKGILELKKFPTPTFIYDMEIIYTMLFHMAIKQNPDWIVFSASDELLESGNNELSLKTGIEQADSDGYNLIQFDRFDFFMTDVDKPSNKIKTQLTYYSYFGDYVYRAWKFFPGIRIGNGGHYPIYPTGYRYKINPKKFILRHYPFRNKTQMKQKMIDRTRGTNYLKINKNRHSSQKYHLKIDLPDKVDHNLLTKYYEDGKWNRNLKYTPYLTSPPQKKQDIFSEEGFLRHPEPTNFELKLRIQEESNKHFLSYIIYRLGKYRRSIKQK